MSWGGRGGGGGARCVARVRARASCVRVRARACGHRRLISPLLPNANSELRAQSELGTQFLFLAGAVTGALAHPATQPPSTQRWPPQII
jgi:hypothetical protein